MIPSKSFFLKSSILQLIYAPFVLLLFSLIIYLPEIIQHRSSFEWVAIFLIIPLYFVAVILFFLLFFIPVVWGSLLLNNFVAGGLNKRVKLYFVSIIGLYLINSIALLALAHYLIAEKSLLPMNKASLVFVIGSVVSGFFAFALTFKKLLLKKELGNC